MVVRGQIGSDIAARVTERIHDLRREQAMSGRELARRLGRSHSWLANLFNGKQAYGLDDIDAIATVLGTTAERLLGIPPSSLPGPVQRLMDDLAEDVMAHYRHPAAGQPEQRALLRIIRNAWRRAVKVDMGYWEAEITMPRQPEPGYDTTPSRPTGRR